MADTKSLKEPALPVKRKPDVTSQDQENVPKSPKLQANDETIQAKEGNYSSENHALEPSGNNEEPGIDSEDEEDDDDDYEDSDDEHDEEEENGNAAVDRKGKGILIEEKKDNSDDDATDSSDGGNKSEGESDLSDDPLAEVDLDNILPSRTRRRVVPPGVYIAKDVGNNGDGGDSDDSDA
ncbi:glutamic acid-rich protein-like [Durio zibethinus]|uniref:Glutamic acid-rich protein-like n=1 Tax=Durio zibethinus TaxID=66656 RepID=A0A6P5ZH64_DURZI|nr:glutamic acid-rich protein-like [Durio zibethinus]XP_022751836.1 glutamic acid-rich protein-like [Durio zibethinus]